MRTGPARVSDDEPSLDLRLDALKKAGREPVFTDEASAVKHDRPDPAHAECHFRSGDLPVIRKPDRPGRTVKGLVELVAGLQEREIQSRSLADGIGTTTPAGRIFLHVMASLIRVEWELMAERTRAGLDAARPSRRPKAADDAGEGRTLLEGGMAPRDVARDLGVPIPTPYRRVPAASS